MRKLILGAGARAVPSPAQLDIASKARSEAARVVRQSFLLGLSKTTIPQKLTQSTQSLRTQSSITTPAGTLARSLRQSIRVAPKQTSAEVAASVDEGGRVGDGRRSEPTKLVALGQSASPSNPNTTIAATGGALESQEPQRARLMIESAANTTRSTEAAVNPFGAAPLLSEKQVAAMLGLEPPTLRNWRVKGQGPRFVRLSRRAVRYSRADVEEWVASRRRRSTSDGGGDHA
jgi:predicted DNA-binding transcriptional regulator AlpA